MQLEATFVAHIVRPFSTHRSTEIVAAPDVEAPYIRDYDGFGVEFVSLEDLIARLSGRPP